MRMLKRIGAGLIIFTFIGCGLGRAQETTDTLVQNGVLMLSGTNIPSIRSLSDDQLNAFVSVLNGTPTISMSDLPRSGIFGTYWSLAQPGLPPLPGDTIGVDVWPMADGSFLLNDLNVDYSSSGSAGPIMMAAATSYDLTPPGSGNGGDYSPDGVTNFYSAPDYGTNIWLLETNVSSGTVSGLISNTAAGVRLELQYTFDLTQPWQSADWFVYGSQTTNWTAFSIPAVSSSNLFLRVRSRAWMPTVYRYGGSSNTASRMWTPMH